MALDPLATPAELADRLKRDEPAAASPELAQWESFLRDASAEMRSAVGSPISRMTSTVTLYPDHRGRVDLPAVPIVAVSAVEVDGAELDPSAWKLRYRTLRLSAGTCDEVTVTFTHGFEPVPDDIVKWTCVLAAASLAAWEATQSLGLTAGYAQKSEAIDDYQISVQGAVASGAAPEVGLVLPDRVAERLRAQYGSGGIDWLEVDG